MVQPYIFLHPDEKDTRPKILSAVHYTYFGSISIVVTVAAIIIFSYTARAPEESEVTLVLWSLIRETSRDYRQQRAGQYVLTG